MPESIKHWKIEFISNYLFFNILFFFFHGFCHFIYQVFEIIFQKKKLFQTRLISDFTALKNRLSIENNDLSRQIEDLENQVSHLIAWDVKVQLELNHSILR